MTANGTKTLSETRIFGKIDSSRLCIPFFFSSKRQTSQILDKQRIVTDARRPSDHGHTTHECKWNARREARPSACKQPERRLLINSKMLKVILDGRRMPALGLVMLRL
jgi:hypothetical protein